MIFASAHELPFGGNQLQSQRLDTRASARPKLSTPVAGFIYRKPLNDDQMLWQHATRSCASAMAFLPDDDVIVAALLDGTLLLVRATTGVVMFEAKARIDGVRTVVFALDASGDRIALGTIDGRVIVADVAALMKQDHSTGWFNLG